MAEATSTTAVQLLLTEQEAKYIKATYQNPLGDGDYPEPPLETKLRESIWTALNEAGVKS